MGERYRRAGRVPPRLKGYAAFDGWEDHRHRRRLAAVREDRPYREAPGPAVIVSEPKIRNGIVYDRSAVDASIVAYWEGQLNAA